MPALFPRLKNWVSLEILYAADLNAEFNNILSNFQPDKMSGWSANLAQLRIQTDPSNTSTDISGNILSSEIERLRYQIALITGNQYWYQAPVKSLTSSGAYRLGFYHSFDANTAYEVFSDSITRGGLPCSINMFAFYSSGTADALNYSASSFPITASKFGVRGLALGSAIFATKNKRSKSSTGSFGVHFKSLSTGDYLAYNPVLGIELSVNGSGFLVAKITSQLATSESTKTPFSVTGTNSVISASFNHALMCYSTNVTSADFLKLFLNGTAEGTAISGTIPVCMGGSGSISTDGGIWFLGAKRNDPTWSHFYAANGFPDAHSDAWSVVTAGTPAVSNGKLSGVGFRYRKTNNLNLTSFTAEFKAMFSPVLEISPTAGTPPDYFYVRVANRSVGLYFSPSGMKIATGGNTPLSIEIPLNVGVFHTYRVTSSGVSTAPLVSIYVDGFCVHKCVLVGSDATGGSAIEFGADASHTSIWEYVAYSNASASAPVAVDTSGFLSDAFLSEDSVADGSTEKLFSSNKATTVLSCDRVDGIETHLPQKSDTIFVLKVAAAAASTMPSTMTLTDQIAIASDGVTPITFSGSASATATSGDNLTGVLQFASSISALTGTTGAQFDVAYNQSVLPAGATGSIFVTRRQVFPAGMVYCNFCLKVETGANVLLNHAQLNASYG